MTARLRTTMFSAVVTLVVIVPLLMTHTATALHLVKRRDVSDDSPHNITTSLAREQITVSNNVTDQGAAGNNVTVQGTAGNNVTVTESYSSQQEGHSQQKANNTESTQSCLNKLNIILVNLLQKASMVDAQVLALKTESVNGLNSVRDLPYQIQSIKHRWQIASRYMDAFTATINSIMEGDPDTLIMCNTTDILHRIQGTTDTVGQMMSGIMELNDETLEKILTKTQNEETESNTSTPNPVPRK